MKFIFINLDLTLFINKLEFKTSIKVMQENKQLTILGGAYKKYVMYITFWRCKVVFFYDKIHHVTCDINDRFLKLISLKLTTHQIIVI